jgi:hypothetical protein
MQVSAAATRGRETLHSIVVGVAVKVHLRYCTIALATGTPMDWFIMGGVFGLLVTLLHDGLKTAKLPHPIAISLICRTRDWPVPGLRRHAFKRIQLPLELHGAQIGFSTAKINQPCAHRSRGVWHLTNPKTCSRSCAVCIQTNDLQAFQILLPQS